jgi:hypothetical protein
VPSQTFSHTATTNAPADQVWAALDKPETWEGIGGVDRVYEPRIDERGRLIGFTFDTFAAGRRYVGKASPHERVEGERIAWRIENSEVRGLTTVDLAPGEHQTGITVTLEVEGIGMLSSMFFGVIATAIGSGLGASVEEFAKGLGGTGNLR